MARDNSYDFRAGDDVPFQIEVTDSEGVALDATGYTYWITLKNSFDDTDKLAVLQHRQAAGDGADDDPTNGVIVLMVPKEKTELVESDLYYWDIQEMTADGVVTTIAPTNWRNKIFVKPQVTITYSVE